MQRGWRLEKLNSTVCAALFSSVMKQGPMEWTFQCAVELMTSCVVTTQSLWRHKTSNTLVGVGGSALQVQQKHSGVPALSVASWRHQQTHSWKKKDSNTPTASSHVSSHLLWINMEPVLPHTRMSSSAEILFADARRESRVEENGCGNTDWMFQSDSPPLKKQKKTHKGAHFPPVHIFSAWGWHHLQSLTDVHKTVSWHTGLAC